MTINKIIDYVLHTPFNTNRAILTEMLRQLIVYHGGNPDNPGQGPDTPDTPGQNVIYDGGIEV